VLQAAWRIGQRALKNRLLWLLALAAFLGLSVLQLPFPLIILSAALAGLLANRRWPALFATAKGSHGKAAHFGPALIDDDTPTPAHARFSRSGLLRVFWQAACCGLRPCCCFTACWAGSTLHPDGLVFYQGSLADFWRCLCGAALCVSGRSGALWLAERRADDGRAGAG
jgi:hypothetical protein